MEISQDFQQLFIALINPMDQVSHFILFEIFAKGLETVLHEISDFDRVMILVIAVNGETDRTDESSIFTVPIDADKGGILLMLMAGVGFDKL